MRAGSLADLETFVRVVEQGSLSAAARLMGLSANGVSRRMQRLERELGVRLLVRTTHRLAVTPEGAAFHTRCRRALAELEEAESEIGRSRAEVRGRVRLALPAAAAGAFLRRLPGLLQAHPGLEVQLIASHQPVDLVTGALDVVVRPGKPVGGGLVTRRLGSFVWRLAASRRYLDGHGRPRTPGDLAQHSCLRFLGAERQREWRLVRSDGTAEVVPVGGQFECDDSRVLGDAVYAGVGIGIRSVRELDRAVADGELEVVLPDYTFGDSFELYALLAPRGGRARRVEVVLEAVRQSLAEL